MDHAPDYHLFLQGGSSSAPDSIEALSHTTGMSRPDAKGCLNSRFPRLLSSHQGRPAAETARDAVLSAGLMAFVVPADALRKPMVHAQAGAARIEPDHVEWWHAHRDGAAPDDLGEIADRTIRQTRDHVRALFAGRIRRSSLTTRSLVEQPTAQGLPVAQRTRPDGVSRTHDAESILLIKARSPDAYLLIAEQDFDYRCLGADKSYSTIANFNALRSRVRAVFPDAFYNEDLLQFTGDLETVFRGATSSKSGIEKSMVVATETSSNLGSLLQMARLLCYQFEI